MANRLSLKEFLDLCEEYSAQSCAYLMVPDDEFLEKIGECPYEDVVAEDAADTKLVIHGCLFMIEWKICRAIRRYPSYGSVGYRFQPERHTLEYGLMN